MGSMGYAESNRCRWVGVRPAHGGTQVMTYCGVNNSTGIVYTVPAGKTFYLCWANIVVPTVTTGHGELYIRNLADVFVFELASVNVFTAAAAYSGPFIGNPPLEVPEGYDVCILSSTAGLIVIGNAFGWVA